MSNTVALSKWLMYQSSEVVRLWPWSGHELTRREVLLATGKPTIYRTGILVNDVQPVVAVVTQNGETPKYVRRVTECDGIISFRVGVEVAAYQGIQSPVLHFMYQAFGSLILCLLALFIGFIAAFNLVKGNAR